MFVNTNSNSSFNSYTKFILFYLIPIGCTSIFSLITYPKLIFIFRKFTKNFYLLNGITGIVLISINVRIYALTQTYIGFKFIKDNYQERNKAILKNNDLSNKRNNINTDILINDFKSEKLRMNLFKEYQKIEENSKKQ